MLSSSGIAKDVTKHDTGPLVCFYCPECRREFGLNESLLKPGPVLCGWCHINRKAKVRVVRDFTAERASKEERIILTDKY